MILLLTIPEKRPFLSYLKKGQLLILKKRHWHLMGGILTYNEVDTKATRLAGVLQTCNIGPGDFVGLLLRRSPEMIICLLAIFKTGAAYVPLNLTDPENRTMSIIEAAGLKFVIANNDNGTDLTGKCIKLIIEDLFKQLDDPGLFLTNH